jgi:hypothetical protein
MQVIPHTYIGAGYNLDYRWYIKDYNADKGMSTDFSRYGYTHTSSSSGLSASFLFDTRDDVNQSTHGTYINFQFISYLKPLGSNSNWSTMVLDMRKYFSLSRKWYLELACWSYVWLILNGKPPYLDMPSVGWDAYNNTGRGYTTGRYRGLNMLYLETELRFDIMPNGLLGGVVFGNLQSFTESSGSFF